MRSGFEIGGGPAVRIVLMALKAFGRSPLTAGTSVTCTNGKALATFNAMLLNTKS
jgi:hypothetical protein